MISLYVTLVLTIANAGCVLHTPHSVGFFSKNLKTFLMWERATGGSNETLYQVEYTEYGNHSWIQKKECWNISMAHCDLTTEIKHLSQWICARVKAISHSNESAWGQAECIPHIHMTIDPPRFRLVPGTNSMQVHIHPFENFTGVEKTEYTIHYKQKNGHTLLTKRTALHTDRMEDLAPGTEYCVSVFSTIRHDLQDHKSATADSCAFTEKDESHGQLIKHVSAGLLALLPLISALLLLFWAFRFVYRPLAPLPLNLVFTVQEWKTLQKKAYVDMKQYGDDVTDRNTNPRPWAQSKAKTNLYIKLPQRPLVSERPIVTPSDGPLLGLSAPPACLEGVCHVPGYAPQLSSPAAQTDESYGAVHHGPGLTDARDFSSAGSEPDSMLSSNAEPVYTNSEHPEPAYTNREQPRSPYINSDQPPDLVYVNSGHLRPVYSNSDHCQPVYTNCSCSKLVYTNLQHPKPVDINSEPCSK